MESSIITTLSNIYIIIELVGDGGSGNVYKISDKNDNIYIAKVYDSNRDFIIETNNFYELKGLSCVINLIDEGLAPFKVGNSTQNKNFLILENASHKSLEKYIDVNHTGLSEDSCKILLFDIINAVSAMHSRGICHKDIKPDNILLTGDKYDLKLCDFGYSESFLDSNNKKIKLRKFFGTPGFYAPEVGENIPFDGEKADIYSIGNTIFSLLIGIKIFDRNIYNFDLYKLIKKGNKGNIEKFWSIIKAITDLDISKNFKNLFINMVLYNPQKRYSINQILNSKWMHGAQNLNRNILINELKERESKF